MFTIVLTAAVTAFTMSGTALGRAALPYGRGGPPVAALWGGDLAIEGAVAVRAVQSAMQLCNTLACEMVTVESGSSGKTMEECDVTAGISFIKPGDSTPVTAADFAIQALVSSALQQAFPNDRFMGEEDAADLRADEELRALSMRLCGVTDEAAFLSAVDRGLEPSRGAGERVWVLDPIDGTKGFMTGQGYVIGLALLDGEGEALIGVMGVPPEEQAPPIMAAVKGHGLKWWTATGDAPMPYEPPQPAWLGTADGAAPPWLISPQDAFPRCAPFGEGCPPRLICCGAMIKYFDVAAGRSAGFVQAETSLKTWDHACGLICVSESGGKASDASGGRVLFPDRTFGVSGGIVCTSKWADGGVRQALLAATGSGGGSESEAAMGAAGGAPPAGFEWGATY